MSPDPIELPDAATRGVLGGPLQIELRGYEVAKWDGKAWDPVAKFRASEKGRLVAIGHAKWLTEREQERAQLYRLVPVEYRVRAIVSLEPPEVKPAETETEEATNG